MTSCRGFGTIPDRANGEFSCRCHPKHHSAVDASVAVVVPTHNRASRLARLVRSLEEQELRPAEVIVVDDGSGDDTPAVLAALVASTPLPLAVIRIEAPAGPAVARNRGWRAASAPLVAFTDDDCRPSAAWLARSVAALESSPRVGIVQGAVRPASAERNRWDATREIVGPTAYFEGCNLLVRREALEQSGGFGETLGMGGEDTWLGWAVLRRGWERAFAPDAVVVHDVVRSAYRWHLRQAWLNGNVAPLVKEFPGLRDAFWRPWAFRASHAALLAGAIGALMAPRRPVAAALTLPYLHLRLWQQRTARPDRDWARDRALETVLDVTEVASTLRLALRSRVLLV
jgi:GT2 family glycosyltransferase